ncbi:MAG: hypothetical protein WDM86_23295 [Rhizomicrobium sp.]
MICILPVFAALVLASCAGSDPVDTAEPEPDTGMASVLQDTFVASSDFAGHPFAAAVRLGPGPAADLCEATARNRAQDIASEGYDAALQQRVYVDVLADCRMWSRRR